MAVLFGDSSSDSIGYSDTLAFDHTCPIGVNLLLVEIAVGPNDALSYTQHTRTVTFDSSPMTSLGAYDSYTGPVQGFVEVFYLWNPPTGAAKQVAISAIPESAACHSIEGCATSYKNVASLGAPVINREVGGGAPSVSVSSAAGHKVIAAFCSGSAAASPTDTVRCNINFDGLTGGGTLLVQDQDGETTAVLGAAANSDVWAWIAFDLIPIADFTKSVTDALGATDSVTINAPLVKTVSDALGLHDDITAAGTQPPPSGGPSGGATLTSASRGNSIVGTTSTVWTNADIAHVCDGEVGSIPGTRATWRNSTPNAVGTITIGYAFPGLDPNAQISAVTATIRHTEGDITAQMYPTVQLLDVNGNPIGAAQAGTYFSVAHTDILTVGTPTAAQAIAGLRIKVSAVRGDTSYASTFYLDFVDLALTYTIAPARTVTDPLGLSDSYAALRYGGLNQYHTDTAALTDSISTSINVSKTVHDIIRISDASTMRIPIPPTILDVPSTGPPPTLGMDQVVTLHEGRSGIALDEFGPQDMTELVWGREQRDVSTCQITLPSLLTLSGKAPNIVPWLHWVTVWDRASGHSLWSGPIQRPIFSRQQTVIQAKDPAALMARLRVPLTRRWENVDVSEPAAQMWRMLIEANNLKTPLIVRPDTQGGIYDYQVTADEEMTDKAIADLVQLGLRWTVVSGTVILGPAPREPIAELGEDDFVGDSFELVRDGAGVYNDILLRGPDNLSRARVDLYGLNLQTIQRVDSVFGVSNADHAAQQFARYVSQIRDTLGQPSGAVLHPLVPLSWDQLIPSARVSVSAFGGRWKMEIESLSVAIDSRRAEAAVKLESVIDIPDLPELAVLAAKKKSDTGVAQQ